jgi:thioredoxin 1
MTAALSELSNELGRQVDFGRINGIENNNTARIFNVTSYPTILIFRNGTLVGKEAGFGSKLGIVSKLKKLKPELNTSLVTSEKSSETKAPAKALKNCSEIKKQKQPLMEAFVVTYCPFGLQMQRILTGIVSQIPDFSQNIKIRYMVKMAEENLTSMHGQDESDENLRQICVREEQSEKYWKYITCFTESGNASQCLKTAEVDEIKLDGCLVDERRGLRYAIADFNITQQFDITASPTLLLNGKIVEESNFGGRTEEAIKDLLCCGFSSKPDICDTILSKEKAKVGFASKMHDQRAGRAKAAVSLETIPLIDVGENSPSLPMLVTDETMNKALKKYPVFVLMGFAGWCRYCQMMNSTILELSRELTGRVAFGLIDAEKNNETAQKYNLVSYPRLLIFGNGMLMSTHTGYRNTSQFSSILEGLEPTLNRSLVNTSIPSVAPQKPGSTIELSGNRNSENDTALRYLERILEAVEINRTTGNTINVFIINANK